MSNENEKSLNLKGSTWPPDYSQYKDLSDDALDQIVENEAQNTQAPEAYKVLFGRLLTYCRSITESNNRYQQQIHQLNTKCENYLRYIEAARENFENVSELYKEEHIRVLNLREDKLELRLQIETYKNELKQAAQQLSETQKAREEVIQEHERYKELAGRNAEKQGLGRKNLEETLVEKEQQVEELQKAVAQLQNLLSLKEVEIRELNTRNKAISIVLEGTRHLQQQQQQQQQQNHLNFS
ncbi:hypothetical protein BCV72DRAFT_237921 [Rhizopus microsporus var. microsporus]|uniref:Uncharacterized protein n=2 Tax=Rhizopus microsporus TaxID=58291 RepID=A0A2G4STV7_RHIZD|nr:uncharacterized protein RHIMIDRAFT_251967 [Rhizopus microsporus ATCC 52813]ORE11509.1 hypothetical protein BCV72DRAFT_237921 [Rhizopus microsporus var. microsporus]PHZ12191.1 hypothetical protein RHIMIDRAFT_251967 [Rhizopus microsporus ATCC 52813]